MREWYGQASGPREAAETASSDRAKRTCRKAAAVSCLKASRFSLRANRNARWPSGPQAEHQGEGQKGPGTPERPAQIQQPPLSKFACPREGWANPNANEGPAASGKVNRANQERLWFRSRSQAEDRLTVLENRHRAVSPASKQQPAIVAGR